MECAVVTGAGSGIGRAVAVRLAGEGYRVVLVGRRAGALQETLALLAGIDHVVCPADLTDPVQVEGLAASIGEEVGPVDALVHVAGGGADRVDGSLGGLRAQMVDTFVINAVSAAMLTEALLPSIREGRGRVVAFSSIAAFRGGGVAYASAKAALHGWAFTAAAAAGDRSITVNVVAPGYVVDTEFFGDTMTPERHARLVGETMVGRPGVPDDVAACVSYLVSDGARHLTGQVLQVNGGALCR